MVGTQQQRKGRWTRDEDNMLKNFVATNNIDCGGEDIDWGTLEQEFNGTRDSKQIRERWVNHLNPTIKKRKFSEDEKKVIDEECSKHKFKWAKIAKKIPNATPLMIKNYYNNRLKKKNPANRKLNNSNTVSYAYTLNNFNNATTTATTTTTTLNITNNNLNNHNNNSNHNHNYHPENDISYYKESNLSRSSSSRTDRTDRTAVESSLSRNSSIRTINSTRTLVDPMSSSLPSPPLSSGMPEEKLVTLATIADIYSQTEKPKSPTNPPTKSKIMSISSLIS